MENNKNDDFEILNVGLPETWTPEKEGDTVQGKYVEKQEGVGENGSTIYVLENEKGKISIWDTTVLANKMKEIKLLDEVRIKYLGLKTSPKSGREYKDFEIGVKRA